MHAAEEMVSFLTVFHVDGNNDGEEGRCMISSFAQKGLFSEGWLAHMHAERAHSTTKSKKAGTFLLEVSF